MAKDHPELSGLWLRDLRKAGRTAMTDAGVPEPAIRRLLGHSLDVSQGYYELTVEAAEAAVLTLSLGSDAPPSAAGFTAGHGGQDVHSVSR